VFITYYHNVVEGPIDDLDRRSSRLSVEAFRKQMTFLAEQFRPISLEELLDRARKNRLDPMCVAVTFDDAYEGVGKLAAPILAELGIPATVFVVTETLNNPKRPLHFEEFELALRRTKKGRIEVPELNLQPFKLGSQKGKAMFLKRVKPLLKEVPDQQRQELHRTILQKLEVDPGELKLSRTARKLSPSQLQKMSSTELWEIGGHTRTHRVLSQISIDEARQEIEGCFFDLQESMKTPPRYFAYPYGKPKHTGDTHKIVAESAFQAALTTSTGSLTPEVDPFRIPRVDFLDLMACQNREIQQKARDFFYS
jgi:peptidoglycan/xylan/chitin deacetylase (PgdA/CDA1 family)